MEFRISKHLSVIAAAAAIAMITPVSMEARLFGKKKAQPQETIAPIEKKDLDDFRKGLKDAEFFPGMIDAYLEKDGKLILAFPDTIYDHTYMLVSRVNGISETGDLVAGQMNVTPLVVRFSKDPFSVYMHIIQDNAVVDENDPIKVSFDRNFIDPVVKGFRIKNYVDGKTYIDATDFFKGDEKLVTPIKDQDPLSILLSGRSGVDGTHYAEGSTITKVKSFPGNLLVESRLAYTTAKVRKPYTISVARSIVKLPDEPMRQRLQDNRVGYFWDTKTLYSSNLDGIKPYQIINRFRIEPKEEDLDRYFAGELVEPKQKIIFYIDSAFPDKWKPAVKEGVEYWNTAFEAAGFKNVMEARDYPTDDPYFDPDDIRTNCVRYCVTPVANAMGPSHADPRSGEILGADVIWYHNVAKLVHNWRFAQTAAVDDRVRKPVFDDDVMHESLTYVTAHEIGHCLGLMHNMGASYAFTIENLRDPEFTQKYGTTPSIMDYARNNFVAQPGDRERGVRLTPPPVGVYDIHAINWGYRLIPGNPSLFEEKPILDKWIREHDGDPMYEFGAQQLLGLIDPTDQTEDLSNDHIEAGNLAVSNLKIIMENFEDWAGEKDENYEEMLDTYKGVVSQYARHISHVIPYIGGIRYKEIRQGHDDGDARNFLPKEDQKKALAWLFNQARTCGWIEPASLISKFEETNTWRRKMENSMVGCCMSPVVLGRIQCSYKANPEKGYRASDFMDDAVKTIFEASYQNRPLDEVEFNLQSTALAALLKGSGLEQSGKDSSKKGLCEADAIADFNEFVSLASAPALPCSLDGCRHAEVPDEARGFFRIALGDAPLPPSELKPLMTRQLRNIQKLYSRLAKSEPDMPSREFYQYQLRILNDVLDTN